MLNLIVASSQAITQGSVVEESQGNLLQVYFAFLCISPLLLLSWHFQSSTTRGNLGLGQGPTLMESLVFFVQWTTRWCRERIATDTFSIERAVYI